MTAVVCVLAVMGTNGCGLPAVGLAELEDPDPVVRIRAARWAGENKKVEAVPALVNQLSDDGETVRLFAIGALKRITGKDYGYQYQADARSRAAGVKRWREALESGAIGGGEEDDKAGKSD